MLLNYDLGDSQRPRGHALLYFRGWSDSSAIFATYLIVPPISVEITKYIPPMFAAQFEQLGNRGISVFPYPPIPERVESLAYLESLARARGDDLISGGTVDAASPDRLLASAGEAAQQYFASYSSYIESASSEALPEPEPAEQSGPVDVSELLYGLMGERDRLAEMAKLCGKLRYAVAGKDAHLMEESVTEIKRLSRYLPEKFKADDTLKAAQRTGPEGDQLTQLYLDRAFRLADEDYESVRELDTQILKLL